MLGSRKNKSVWQLIQILAPLISQDFSAPSYYCIVQIVLIFTELLSAADVFI